MQSLEGHLLVASPRLPDPNFFRSVVLLIQHDEEGAFGVVLNRPTRVTLREIWQQVAEESCDCDEPLNQGGPVAGPLIAVHACESLGEKEILPGVYFTSEKDALREIVSQSTFPFHVFAGYAGWGGGQLEGELKVGGWLTTRATQAYVFGDQSDMWKRVAASIGNEILSPTIRSRHVPQDPTLN